MRAWITRGRCARSQAADDVSNQTCHVIQEISARRVAAAVERQVQQLGWAAQRNLDIQEGWELTEEYLEHSGINVEGAINQIRGRLDHVRGVCHRVFRDHAAHYSLMHFQSFYDISQRLFP